MKRYQVLMLTLPVAFGLGACDAEDILGTCDPLISVKVETFSEAAATLGTVSASIQADVFTACNNIAVSMGETAIVPAASGAPTDDEVKSACNLVKAGLSAEIEAGATVNVVFEPPVCTINAQASVDCSARCDVNAACTPGQLEVMCEGGELSVSCEGTCEGELSCEVSASAECGATCEGSCSGGCTGSCEGTAMCEGSCEGSCTGTAMCEGKCEGTCEGDCSVALNQDGSCDGDCMGTCEGSCSAAVDCMGECKGTCSASLDCQGSCDATCEGSCEGSCKVEAEADCNGEVRCEGSCMGTATAPKCTGNVMPPSCTIDADCQAGCETQASLEAECTEPSVTVTVEASASADIDAVITALEDNLPLLLSITAKGELLGQAAADTVDAFGELVTSAGTIPACVAEFGASVAASAQASVEASVSVSVSIEASASVSGCASSGDNCDEQM